MKIAQFRPPACKKADKQHHAWKSRDWIAETKWDGHRATFHYDEDGKRWLSRRTSEADKNSPDFVLRLGDNSHVLPYLTEELAFVPEGTVLDGELMGPQAVGQDSNYVTTVMNSAEYARAKGIMDKDGYLIFAVFDMPFYAGQDIRKKPLKERRAMLEELLSGRDLPHVALSVWCEDDKEQFFNDHIDKGLEGIILKHLDSPYEWAELEEREKRSKWWLKAKNEERSDCAIIGYTLPKETSVNVKGQIVPNQFYVRGWISGLVLGQFHTEKPTERELRDLLSGDRYREWQTTYDEVLEYIRDKQFEEDGKTYYLYPVGVSTGITFAVRGDISDNKEKYLGKVVEIEYNKRFGLAFRHPRVKRFRDQEKGMRDAIYREDEA